MYTYTLIASYSSELNNLYFKDPCENAVELVENDDDDKDCDDDDDAEDADDDDGNDDNDNNDDYITQTGKTDDKDDSLCDDEGTCMYSICAKTS